MAKTKTKPEPLTVCTYAPVQRLYEAAKACCDIGIASVQLKQAVAAIERVAKESQKLEHIRKQAEEVYVDSACDIDIDEANFTHHNGEPRGEGGGFWVGAWLWVPEGE